MGSLLAIDVGKKNLHMAEGNLSKNGLVVERVASFPLPKGIFNGESIMNLPALTDAIGNAVKAFGFRTKDAVVTFDAYGAVIRDIDLPMGKPKEIASMIKTEMRETYHVSPEDVIQYKVIDKVISESGAPLDRYRVTAINKEIVEAYHDVLTEAKLKPVAMDININAIDKLLAGEVMINDKLTSEAGTMVIDFGEILTTVYIVTRGKPIFFRQLDFGSSEIEKLISEETMKPEEDIIKMKEEGFNVFGGNEEEETYAAILRPFFYSLTDEIRKIIGFYTSRSGAAGMDRVFLCGGGSNLFGLGDFLEASIGAPAEQIAKISNVKIKDSAIPIASFMNAIGALIRY